MANEADEEEKERNRKSTKAMDRIATWETRSVDTRASIGVCLTKNDDKWSHSEVRTVSYGLVLWDFVHHYQKVLAACMAPPSAEQTPRQYLIQTYCNIKVSFRRLEHGHAEYEGCARIK
jgi:hypothetical protein